MSRWLPLLTFLVVPLTLVVWGCLWAIGRLAQRRFQYSLRTLLIAVTAVAVVLSAFTAWNRWTKAQLELLDADAPAFAFLKMTPEIGETTDPPGFKATFRPRYRGIGEVERISDEVMFNTLDDGTFFIPIKPPIDPQYSFEIYYGGKKMVSTTFSLDPATPEMFVIVRVR
jgi:hypothetical protein